jgi:hypothetical protein
MRGVGIEGMDERRPFENQADPGVAMTVDPPLVTLGQAKPPLQFEIIPDRLVLLLSHEQAVQEAEHHRGHAVTDRVLGRLEAIDQCLELLLALGDVLRPGFERRGHLRDQRDVLSDDLLLLLDFLQAAVDAPGQAAELLLREPPFFSSRLRSIDALTSLSAAAIRRPGGSRGPP